MFRQADDDSLQVFIWSPEQPSLTVKGDLLVALIFRVLEGQLPDDLLAPPRGLAEGVREVQVLDDEAGIAELDRRQRGSGGDAAHEVAVRTQAAEVDDEGSTL